MRINFVGWKINIRLISIKNNTTYVEMICIKANKVASPKRLALLSLYYISCTWYICPQTHMHTQIASPIAPTLI
jgi:hypothetical protein